MKVANITIILGADKLNEKIADVATKGKTLDTLIHRTAVSCVYHAREHGDSTQLRELVDAMPKSGRRKALIDWVEAHVPVDKSEDEKGMSKTRDTKDGYTLKLRKGRKPEEFLLAECAAKPFWDYTPDRSTAPMTLNRALASFERALKKAVTQGKASESDVKILTDAVSAAMSHTSAANDASNPGLTAVS